MPKSVRGTLKTRRTCRKKIHERITAVSGMDLFPEYCLVVHYGFKYIAGLAVKAPRKFMLILFMTNLVIVLGTQGWD